MRDTTIASAALLAALLTVPGPASAQIKENSSPDKAPQTIAQVTDRKDTPETNRESVAKVVYVPPRRGAPSVRVIAATRGQSSRVFLATLAPNHVGWTTRAQPTLYWYISGAVDEDIALTIVDNELIDPVLELRLRGPLQDGIQALDLERQGVRLTKGREYAWSVSIVHDNDQRSKDVFAEAAITMVDPSPSLKKSLQAAGRGDRPRLLAEAGFWYDAFNEISKLAAENRPDVTRWKRERAELLEQVGIGALAAGE